MVQTPSLKRNFPPSSRPSFDSYSCEALLEPASHALGCPIVLSWPRMKKASSCQMKTSGPRWTHSCLQAMTPPPVPSHGFSTAYPCILSTSVVVGKRFKRFLGTGTPWSGERGCGWAQSVRGKSCAYRAILETRRGQLTLVIFPSRLWLLGGNYARTQPWALSLTADHFQMCLVKVVKRLTFRLAPSGGRTWLPFWVPR